MDDAAVDLQLDRPHSARMYDYYLGGTTNFPADREAVSRVLTAFPQALIASRANRAFMRRATAYLAEHGLRQFLDVGTGIPTQPNLHEVAQSVAPDARVVYVDNDPIVLAHAQALLISAAEGRTAYVEADLCQPEDILKASVLHETLDLSRPVALSLNAVLHFVPDDDEARRIVDAFTDALAPGSALVVSHATADATANLESVAGVYRSVGTTVGMRSRERFTRLFERWELIDPGVTFSHLWRPDAATAASAITEAESSCYVAVARKIA
jgi:hypothetical protein